MVNLTSPCSHESSRPSKHHLLLCLCLSSMGCQCYNGNLTGGNDGKRRLASSALLMYTCAGMLVPWQICGRLACTFRCCPLCTPPQTSSSGRRLLSASTRHRLIASLSSSVESDSIPDDICIFHANGFKVLYPKTAK